MAKRKAKRIDVTKEADVIEAVSNAQGNVSDTFTNSTGKEVFCNPIAHDYLDRLSRAIEKKYRERGEPVDPPTYEFEAEGGEMVRQNHDETTVETDEEKEAWQEHQDARQRLEAEQGETAIRALCLRGINFDKHKKEFKRWQEEESFIRELPESEAEQKYEFARSELVITVFDLGVGTENEFMGDGSKLAETCLMLGFKGATSEQIVEARRLFRSEMAKAGAGTNGTERSAAEGEE